MRSAFALAEALRAARLLATDPRAGRDRIQRGVGVVRAAILLRGCDCGELVNATGRVRVVAGGDIRVGDRVQLGGGMIATELICHPGGRLHIGARSFLNYGVSIEASSSIRIGERCMFGSMSRIRDRSHGRSAAVVLGDDVWVAHGAIVEPGVTIGEGSVVSAGSVVVGDIPPFSLAIGNPATAVPLVERPPRGP